MFGDMKPYVYKTTDYGKTWTALPVEGERRSRLCARDQGRHRRARTCCFWARNSGCGSRSTAASTGRSTRAAISRRWRCATSWCSRAVRPGPGHSWPRHLDHRRHLAAARADAGIDAKNRSLLTEPARQWSTSKPMPHGRRATRLHWTAAGPTDALITYYQRSRHIFGDMKIEVFDQQGKLWTPSRLKHRGVNRATWSMRLKAPNVPPAASGGFRRAPGTAVAARHLYT